MESTSENNFTMDNLPDSVIHLGHSQFLVVRSFQGHTRVHIRKFVENEAKQLHPTKDGVSLTPRVWAAAVEKLPKLLSKRYFDRYPDNYVDVIERDLCIFKNTISDGPVERIEIMLQRMFQRRDRSFQFVPETVHLDEQQCYVLLSSCHRVKELIENSLLTVTLRHHVEKLVLEQASAEAQGYIAQPYSKGLYETTDSLRKCFFECLSLQIKEMAPCYGCDEMPCTCHTAEELLNTYFETALYVLNYDELAQNFVGKNMHQEYFVNIILCKNFFLTIDVSSFLTHVKRQYAPSEDMLIEEMEIC